MKTISLTFHPDTGWNQSLPVEMDSPSTLIFIFASTSLADQSLTFWKDLLAQFPQSRKIGCTSFAPVFQDGLALDQVVISIIHFDHVDIKTARSFDLKQSDSLVVGRSIAEELNQGPEDLKFVFVVGDDRFEGIDQLVEGISQTLDPSVTVAGGFTGHTDYFGGKRAIFVDDMLDENIVAAVGIYGNSLIVNRHWEVGFEHSSNAYEVTRSEGKWLFELDSTPALEVYERFLGVLAQYLDSGMIQTIFPVGFYDQPDGELKYVRSVVVIDRDKQALCFAGEIPPARYARMMTGLTSHLSSAAGSVSKAAHTSPAGKRLNGHGLSIMVSCVGRFATLLDQKKAVEVEAAFSMLPDSGQLVGFYAGGEIGNIAANTCSLLNHTVSMIYLDEN